MITIWNIYIPLYVLLAKEKIDSYMCCFKNWFMFTVIGCLGDNQHHQSSILTTLSPSFEYIFIFRERRAAWVFPAFPQAYTHKSLFWLQRCGTTTNEPPLTHRGKTTSKRAPASLTESHALRCVWDFTVCNWSWGVRNVIIKDWDWNLAWQYCQRKFTSVSDWGHLCLKFCIVRS